MNAGGSTWFPSVDLHKVNAEKKSLKTVFPQEIYLVWFNEAQNNRWILRMFASLEELENFSFQNY
jgi:hypothetical protein